MSDTENKLLERIAALEGKLSAPPAGQSFDKRKATLNPIGYFKELGMDITHLSRHFVANALGKDCPPELSAMVQMGPQIAATSHLEELVTSLSRKVDQLATRQSVDSLKTKPVDHAKYPTLAAAVKADPSILDRELASIGDTVSPEEALKKVEEKLSTYAKAFNFKPPSSQDTNKTETIQNPDGSAIKSDITPATVPSGEVPPLLPNSSGGVFTADEHERLKNAVLRKNNLLTS